MLTLNGHYFFCINLDLHEHTNTHIEKELKQKRFTEKKKYQGSCLKLSIATNKV